MTTNATTQKLPGWKTEAGRSAFMAAYQVALGLWPVPYASLWLPTRWGNTHVIASGPLHAPPLVLLHGYYATAAMWYPNVAALSQHYRVYAVDEIGQPGQTAPAANITGRADLAEWLLDVFKGLHIDKADVAGHSYGGWLTANLALYAPQAVDRIILLAPAGTVTNLRLRFMLFALPMIVWPSDATINAFFGWLKQGFAPETRLMRLMNLGMRHWHAGPSAVYPTAFSDAELRGLAARTLLLVGEREVIYDRHAALARAQRLIPQVEAEFVPGACHLLTVEQADLVNARLLKFLTAESSLAVPA